MRKIGLLSLVILGLVATSAGATPVVNVFWQGPGAATNYTTSALNWTPNAIPNNAYENVTVNTPAANILIMPASGSYTVGQFNVVGTGTVRIPTGSTATFTVTNADNLTGNVSILTGSQANSSSMTWNVYGDWRLGTVNDAFDVGVQQLNLRGTNKFVQKGGTGNNGVNYGAANDGYTINTDIYGSYAADPGQNTDLRNWRFKNLKVKSTGSITGGFWVVRTLQVESGGQLVRNLVNPTNFIFYGRCNSSAANNDNTNTTTGYGGGKLALPGGITFPNNVELGTGYSFGNSGTPQALYVWKMAAAAQSVNVGNLAVNGNFYVGRNSTAGVRQGYIAAFNPVDNDVTATPRNAVIRGNLMMGSVNSSSHKGILYIDDCNTSSVIDVGGNVQVGYGTVARTSSQGYGSMHLGGGTVQVGGNWLVLRSAAKPTTEFLYQNWNPGTSTVIFDGNGTVKTQILYTDNMPFYNLVIHTPVGGTVRLSQASDAASAPARDFLRIQGNLRLEQGIFNDQDRAITFNGPNHTLFWDNNLAKVTGNSLDNIILLPNAVLYLDAGTHTKILMDNIDMQLGSKLYLNGFTLMTEGFTFVSSLVSDQGVPYTVYGSNGTIYGTLAIPEPATLLLLGTGVLGVLGYIRRRRIA